MFTEDLTIFFDNSKGFSVPATFTVTGGGTVSANVHFNAPTSSFDAYGNQVESSTPFLLAVTSEVSTVRQGNAVSVNSGSYKVERIEKIDDGKLVNIYLK